jgi:hypothetical protein
VCYRVNYENRLVMVACMLSSTSAQDSGEYFRNWFPRVTKTQAEQPHWITPLFTTTPRLEEEFRADIAWTPARDGDNLNYLGGKGLELIPSYRRPSEDWNSRGVQYGLSVSPAAQAVARGRSQCDLLAERNAEWRQTGVPFSRSGSWTLSHLEASGLSVGAGEQIAVTHFHQYNHAPTLSVRFPF